MGKPINAIPEWFKYLLVDNVFLSLEFSPPLFERSLFKDAERKKDFFLMTQRAEKEKTLFSLI